MKTNSVEGQVSLYDLGIWCGKTSPEPSLPENQRAKISASSSKKYAELAAIPYMFLDLTPGTGNLLGQYEWEMLSPWRGESSIRNTGPAPRSAAGVSTLSQILQAKVPRKYYLSKTACLGILRRAEERGKELPETLERALRIQSGLSAPDGTLTAPMAFAQNQRDEVRDLHDVAGALAAQPGMKQQTFVAAGFSAGAGKTAGSTGYHEDVAPTLRGGQSGNMMPSVLNVYENHGIDARYTKLNDVAPTMSARYGTGGNNVPLVEQASVYCIAGNIIDRQPENGGNGFGYQADLAYTITAMDRHAVFSRQRVDQFKADEVASTESARQHKDATDLVLQEECDGNTLLIRRLTPLECERLQGFPDGWTALPGASDAPRYKALGNSVAIPCVEYVMQGIARAMENEAQ